jgi:transposase
VEVTVQARPFSLSQAESDSLSKLIGDGATSKALAGRAQVILLSAAGTSAKEVAEQLGFTQLTVYKWRRRYRRNGLAGLRDLARPGQPRKLPRETRLQIVTLTRFTIPSDAAHWSIRRMARFAQVTEHQVRSIWREEQLNPGPKGAASGASAREYLLQLLGVCLAPQLSLVVFERGASEAHASEEKSRSKRTRTPRAGPGRRGTAAVYALFDGVVPRDASADSPPVLDEFLERVALQAPENHALFVALVDSPKLDEAHLQQWLVRRELEISRVPTVGHWLCELERRCAELERRTEGSPAQRSALDFRRAARAFAATRRTAKSHAPFSWTPSVRHASVTGFLLALFFFAWPRPSHAYAWMLRHGYAQCAQCHVDPSGSGALTEYGRAMGEIILPTRYDEDSAAHADDEGGTGKFLFGAVDLPEGLELGGDLRALSLHTKVDKVELSRQLIWMQMDLHAAVSAGPFVASGTLGYAPRGALGATLTRGTLDNWISREHWLGFWLDDDHATLLRAGRMNLPFGIRSIEHTLWARAYTRSDSNDEQQYGLTFTYMSAGFRAEIMGILGNFQVRPDVFRERGYSAYGEWFALPKLGLGASSRISHVALDTQLLREEWRHAHGVFARWATDWEPLVLLSEWDYVFESPKYQLRRTGLTGFVQADLEATQGVHFMGTFEAANVSTGPAPLSWGAWLSYAWFFVPHADIRLDNLYQSFATSSGRTGALSFLIQGHVYL